MTHERWDRSNLHHLILLYIKSWNLCPSISTIPVGLFVSGIAQQKLSMMNFVTYVSSTDRKRQFETRNVFSFFLNSYLLQVVLAVCVVVALADEPRSKKEVGYNTPNVQNTGKMLFMLYQCFIIFNNKLSI